MTYNPNNYTDEEKLRWCWLRGTEWGAFPLYISQIITPILMLFFKWWILLIGVVILTWLWALIRYKFVSLILASISGYVTILKWIVSLGMGIYFLTQKQYINCLASSLYPFIVLLLMFIVPSTKIGVFQEMFMNKIGYEKKGSE